MTQLDALTEALRLAITAETEAQSLRAIELAESFTSGLSEFEIAQAKKAATL